MNDRLPSKPKRRKFTMDDGTVFYATVDFADEPIREGTPLCKETLLPDDVALKLCPGISDPTPGNALASLEAGANWWYTAVFEKNQWITDTSKSGYAFSQTVSVVANTSAPTFTANTVTFDPSFAPNGVADDDEASYEDCSVIAGGYRESLPGGLLKVYVRDKPTRCTNIQLYFGGRNYVE